MFNKVDNMSFVVSYGKLVKLIGRDESENILRLISIMDGTLEDKVTYLEELVWSLECMKAEEEISIQMCN